MIFNKRAPIVIGVRVEAGIVRVGTPICVPSRECVHLGRIFSIESNHKPVDEARTGMEVVYISRESIDVMKEYFRSDLKKEDWKLMIELKEALDIS
ncbi:putative eif5b-like protein [Schistosoma mansoni]|uniref:putative eif5b-like protein n=1 Tax=Schistosoma mansoni TaxID=6183 RepID=UPI00022DC001|nr:putative eif5b-like protein [Schistosoma mansoni]|eukprot:XP_018649654.1 putative eif5b-like protein [Schistosoma mansoni]